MAHTLKSGRLGTTLDERFHRTRLGTPGSQLDPRPKLKSLPQCFSKLAYSRDPTDLRA